MLVAAIALMATGLGLLAVSLLTSSVIWAWVCIGVCVLGAGLLIASFTSTHMSDDVAASAGRGWRAVRGRDDD